jgi:protein SCO1/2
MFAAVTFASLGMFVLWPMLTTGKMARQSTVGGPFTLVKPDGKEITDKDIAGKPLVISFGFTNCPEVCPTILNDMAGWMKSLGDEADKLNFAFVSVDPERDSPEVMGKYVGHFDKRILGLTGSKQQVAQIVKAYKVYVRKGEVKDGAYNVDHTTLVYLMDGKGRYKTIITYKEKPERAVSKLKTLIAGG